MSDPSYAYVLLPSVAHAMRAEKVLAKAGIDSRLVPVPEDVGGVCNQCIRVAHADRPAAEKTLTEAKVQVDKIHEA